MDTTVPHEEIFIEGLGKHLRIRVLTPEDMEIIESIPERDRSSELILQGVYDCKELMEKLTSVVGSELVSMMVDGRTRPLLARLRNIKADLLNAIYQVNRLRSVRFCAQEQLLVGRRSCEFRVDSLGRLFVSDIDLGETC